MMYVGMMAFYPIPAVAVALVAATAADAATMTTGRACYADPGARKDTVTWRASGLTPGATFRTTLDGRPAKEVGIVDAAGVATGSFAAPALNAAVAPNTLEHVFRLGVNDGTRTAEAQFTVSKLRASFRPTAGDPRTLQVRFSVYGFGLAGATAPPIYLHYVRPDGSVRSTLRLGAGRGDCGSLTTAKRRLFPFDASRGTWTLQFDTARTYARGRPASKALFYRVPVRVG